MKKFLLWIADLCKINLVETKVVENVIVKYIADGDVIVGDVTIKGNLTVDGKLNVTGNVSCLNKV